MKKIIKRMVSLVITIFTMLVFSITGFAEGKEEFDSFPRPKDGTDYSKMDFKGDSFIFGGALEAREEDIIESLKHPKDCIPAVDDSMEGPDRASWVFLSRLGSFVYYGQEQNMSCGAASVRMALKYITGTEYSESTVRSGCGTGPNGTYLSNMVTYANSMQNSNVYTSQYLANQTTMKNNLYAGITTFDAPPIVGLVESTTYGFPYTGNGHFVTIYGIKSDKSEMAIADPWAGHVGDSSNMFYSVTASNLHSAYSTLNLGYMY